MCLKSRTSSNAQGGGRSPPACWFSRAFKTERVGRRGWTDGLDQPCYEQREFRVESGPGDVDWPGPGTLQPAMHLSIHSKFWSGAASGSRDRRPVFVARAVSAGCVVKTLLTEKWPIPGGWASSWAMHLALKEACCDHEIRRGPQIMTAIWSWWSLYAYAP